MAATGGENERITIRELYKLILEQNEERHRMELRLTERINAINGCIKSLAEVTENSTLEINRLRDRSDKMDGLVAGLSVIGATLAGWLGMHK